MNHGLMTLCFAVLIMSALGQEKKDGPAPADDGPSLEVTMKFIQDKLDEQGVLHFAVYTHDNGSGEDSAAKWSFELTDIRADSAKCLLGGHYKITFLADSGTNKQRSTNSAGNSVHGVRAIKKVVVAPASSWWAQELANQSHPLTTARIEPQLFVLSMGRYRSPKTRALRMENRWTVRNLSCSSSLATHGFFLTKTPPTV